MALKRQPFKKLGQALKQPEAIATGALAGAVLGPLGLLIGGAQGVLANRIRKSEFDKRAAEASAVTTVSDGLSESLMSAAQFARTDLEREMLARVGDRQAQIQALAGDPRPEVRARATEALVGLQTEVGGFLEQQQTRVDADRDQARTAIYGGLEQEKNRYMVAGDIRAQVQSDVNSLTRLLNDPGFDIKRPLDLQKALGLLSTTTRSYLGADPEGLDDALKDAGGAGLGGALLSVLGGIMSAEDYDVANSDMYRIAAAISAKAESDFGRATDRATERADFYGSAASAARLELPFTPRAYVGVEKPEPGKPIPQLVGASTPNNDKDPLSALSPLAQQSAGVINKGLDVAQGATTGLIDRTAGEGATAGIVTGNVDAAERWANRFSSADELAASVAGADMTLKQPTPGSEYPAQLRELYEQIGKLAPGTVAKFNADTDQLFAVDTATGEARAMEVNAAQKRALREQARARREAAAKGEFAQ